MSKPSTPTNATSSNRRDFMKQASLAAVGASTLGLSLQRSVHAAGDKEIKIGLIGCGGRGSGAAVNAMNTGKDVKLTAMADWFDFKVQGAHKRLKGIKGGQVAVDEDHRFSGFDGYRKVLESDIDVVLIACAPHFHAPYLKAAIDAGKHVFVEKPHSIDVPGLRLAQQACKDAKQKNLNVVSGLCWRYDDTVCETAKRIRDGQIGEIVNAQATYMAGPDRLTYRDPKWSELEWQMRNWYHFFWFAGDGFLKRLIHTVDRACFAFGDLKPQTVWGMGGRSTCFGPEFGDLFDHQAIVFEYEDGKRLTGFSRDQTNVWNCEEDLIFGTKGQANMKRGRITGEKSWRFKGKKNNKYDAEHVALFDAIRNGTAINNGDYMINSTMMMVLGTNAVWTGKKMTWEEGWHLQSTVLRPEYNGDMKPPVMPNASGTYDVPIPGFTKVS